MHTPSSRWKPVAIVVGIWLAYWLLSVAQSYTVQLQSTGHADPWLIGMRLVAHMSLWILLTPALIAFVRRFRIDRHTWTRNLPLHLVVALLASVADIWVWYRWRMIVGPPVPSGRTFLVQWLMQIDLAVFTYFVIVAIVHAVDYHRWYQERLDESHRLELRTAQLETQLATAQLQMLKMQLQPHFLFNTLHAIAELVHEDPQAADRMVAGLGSLLRISLESAGRQMVTLREELEFLEAYLSIEQVRFRERLSVAVEIDPHALDARVPHLLLQPLVENAIRHGVAPRMAAGRVTVTARRENGRVEIEVADNGRGLPNGVPGAEGVGLRNTRARLEQLYGKEYRLELTNGTAGGAVARLALPYQTGLEEEPLDQQIVAVVER